MFGLLIARDGTVSDQAMTELLQAQLIPFTGFTVGGAEDVPGNLSEEDFLRLCAARLLPAGKPLPMGPVYRLLSRGDARPGNVIRKYVCLQLSLLPYLRVQHEVTALEGCFLVGSDLLVCPLQEDGRVDALLPAGVWTEIATGECVQGRFRRLRGVNEMPVLARENTLLPIGMNDRTTDANDADRLTLHWFQPKERATCTLADGTAYTVWQDGTGYHAQSSSGLPWHVIVHQNGAESLI